MFNGLKAWSYSVWNKYRTCPKQFFFNKIQKLKEPGSAALEKGIHWHNLGETYLKNPKSKLPKEYKLFKKQMKHLRDVDASAEEQWAFRKDWSICGWFDKDCWCRIKLDAFYIDDDGIMTVIDFKTGKVKEDGYTEQLELYALGAMKLFEGLEGVLVELWFLEHGEIRPLEPAYYAIKEVKKLQKLWEKRAKPLFNDTKFIESQSWLCNYCHFRKSNGGPCKYN